MKKFNYSNEIANVVKQFLTEDDWHYSFDEERGIFDFGLRVRSKIHKIKYLIDVKEDEMIVYGICPIVADRDDEKMMAQMAEFICRANYGLNNGCFEFNFRDGKIRYKSFIDCDEVLRSILAEMGADAGDGDVADMIARLAERLGITTEEEATTSETASSEDAAEVHVDLFGKKKAEVA